MIRHFKWHKKRDDSLQHGFMRYSPLDRCEGKFGSCTHDGRQTHYHCLQVSFCQTHYHCLQVSFCQTHYRWDLPPVVYENTYTVYLVKLLKKCVVIKNSFSSKYNFSKKRIIYFHLCCQQVNLHNLLGHPQNVNKLLLIYG